MKRSEWMSDAGYKSGIRAEKKLAKLLVREAQESAAADRVADEWMVKLMCSVLLTGMCSVLIFGAGLASANAGGLDLLGIDSQMALAELGYGWRIWVGGLITSAVLVTGLVALYKFAVRHLPVR